MRVLAEWDSDENRGYRALRKALEESGVEPVDTDAITWGACMGMTEAVVFQMVAGTLTPGSRGWNQAQATVARRFLTTPLHSLDERTPQAAIWEERQEFWSAHPGRSVRQDFLQDVRKQLRRLPDAPAGIAERLRPLTRLLEIAAEGPALTPAGYIAPDLVRQLVKEFDWWQWEKPPRSEADAHQVQTLREFAKEAGLVRPTRGHLHITALGRRSLSDPALLWRHVTQALAADDDFASAIRELLLVRLLQGAGKETAIEAEILPVLAEAGWRPSGGTELTEDMVSYKLWDAIRPMDLLGMVEVGEWPYQTLSLSEFGAISARAILWRRSTAPRQSI
jgi:hypothetical protein